MGAVVAERMVVKQVVNEPEVRLVVRLVISGWSHHKHGRAAVGSSTDLTTEAQTGQSSSRGEELLLITDCC